MRDLSVLCLVLLMAVPLVSQAQGTELRAGAATSNITPPLGGLIVGGWKPFPAAHIHDELHVRCLVLDDGEHRVGFAVCDNLGLPQEVCETARERIPESAGLKGNALMISSTHTHSAVTARADSRISRPEKLTEYQAFVAQRIADAVVCAVNNLEPAEIAAGSALEPREVFNRRWFMAPGFEMPNPFGGTDQVRMNPPRGNGALLRPAGPVDPEVAFLSVRSVDGGRPIALLANYSLHYVGGVRKGEVSADYFAIFSERIAELLETRGQYPPFVGMMTNGTSGNINNINFREKSPRRQPYEKMREVAHNVADQVYQAHESLTFRRDIKLTSHMQPLTLKVRKPTAEQAEYFRRIQRQPEDVKPYHVHEQVYARRVLQQLEEPDHVEIVLQTIGVGDVGVTAIPFEVFVEIGLELKERSPFKQTFNVSLANGSFGYLPTPEHHKLGGYETWLGTSLVEPNASRRITDGLLQMLSSMRPLP